jgi:serine/threonine protein kinase
MGDLVTSISLPEITGTMTAFDAFGITREKLHRLRADEDFMRQYAWQLLQGSGKDYRIEVPDTPLAELVKGFDYIHDQKELHRLSALEETLTMPNRRMALLDFEAAVSLEDAYSAIRRLSQHPARHDQLVYLEASLRDLLLLEEQHAEETRGYDIHLVYPTDDGKICTHYLCTHKPGLRYLKLAQTAPVAHHPGVRFLTRKI